MYLYVNTIYFNFFLIIIDTFSFYYIFIDVKVTHIIFNFCFFYANVMGGGGSR